MRGDRGRVRGAAGRRRRSRRPSPPTPPLRARGAAAARACSTASGELPPRDGNICYRYRIDRGELEAVFAHADHRRRGRVHVPGGLPVRDGDAHRHRAGRRRARSRCGRPASTRSSCAPSSRRCSTCRSRRCASIVPYLGGGFGSKSYTKMEPDHGRAGAQGRAARAHPEPGRRVDGHDAPARHAVPHAHGHDERRPPARPRGRVLVRHRRLRRQRPARDGDRRRRGAGPVPLGGLPRRRLVRLHEHRARRGSYRAFGATHLQWIGELADRRARPPRRARSARGAPGEPVRARRGGARRRQAARRRPHRRRREGRAGRRLGRAEAARTSAAASRSACWPPAPIPVSTAVVRMEADGEVVVLVGTTEIGQGAAHRRSRRSRPRSSAIDAGARHGARHRHPLHAVRPLDRREPLDDARRPRRAARGRRTSARSSWRSPAADEIDPRQHPELFAQHFGLAGGELIGRGEVAPAGHRARTPRARSSGRSASAPPRSRSTPTRATCTCARRRPSPTSARAINPQLVERQDEGGTMQGLGNALLRGDGLRGRRAPEPHDARLPRAELRGPARRDDVHHRRERRRARARTAPRAAARARWPATTGGDRRRASPMPACR